MLKSVPLAHRDLAMAIDPDGVPAQILHLSILYTWTHKHVQALIGAGCGASQNRGLFSNSFCMHVESYAQEIVVCNFVRAEPVVRY